MYEIRSIYDTQCYLLLCFDWQCGCSAIVSTSAWFGHHEEDKITSRRSGLRFLNFADASLTEPASDPVPTFALIVSTEQTVQAVDGSPEGGLRATTLRSLIIFFVFSASVKTFGFGFGFGFGLAFAFAFFTPFGLGLILGFAFDLVLGMALGAVFLTAGFLAAFVFEVVGAFRAAVVVLPVWALGRDTALVVAYERRTMELSKVWAVVTSNDFRELKVL